MPLRPLVHPARIARGYLELKQEIRVGYYEAEAGQIYTVVALTVLRQPHS
jgi:hypothetical protein